MRRRRPPLAILQLHQTKYLQPLLYGDDVAIALSAESTFQISQGTRLFTISGRGLSYDEEGRLAGGEATAFELRDSAAGGLQFGVTDFALDAVAQLQDRDGTIAS